MADDQTSEQRRIALEEQKLQTELDLRKLELDLKAREGGWFAKLFTPLTTTLMAGILTLAASVAGTLFQGRQTLELEREKFQFSKQLDTQKQEHELILKMISVGDEDQAKANLKFLADTGLISSRERAERILKANTSVPVLPAPAGAPQPAPRVDPRCGLPYVSAPLPNNPDNISILNDWQAQNIVPVEIPQLKRLRASGIVLFNKQAAEPLKAAWAEIEQAGLLDRVVSLGPSFVPRLIRGNRSVLSNHACGFAFDINMAENPFGKPPRAAGERGSVVELVPIFEKHGFKWGGMWPRPDAMHFEFTTIREDDVASND